MKAVRYGSRFDIAYALARDIPTLLVWGVGALIILAGPGTSPTAS